MSQRRLSPQQVADVVEMALATPPKRGLVDRARDAWRGWLGPGQPIAITTPAGMEPRRWDYRSSLNLVSRPRATEPISHDELRIMGDFTLVRGAIETCKDQFDTLPWSIGYLDPASEKDPDSDPRVREVTDFFQKPDKIHPFAIWQRLLHEDHYVLDASSCLVDRTKGGKPWAFKPVDGATIHPLIDVTGRSPLEGRAFDQVLHGIPAVPLTRNDLVYFPRNPRTNRLYGFGPVEQLTVTINIGLRRELSQLEYYTAGNIPDLLAMGPENWTVNDLQDAQAYYDSMRGDTARRRGIMVLPATTAIHEARLPPIKDDFDEWLARLCFFFFALPPTWFAKVGMNRATADVMQNTSEQEGRIPRQAWAAAFYTELIRIGFGYTDIGFKWGETHEPDPQVQAQVGEIDVRAGVRSINEVREERGLPPVKGGERPFVLTASGPILLEDIAAGLYAPPTPEEKARAAAEAQAQIANGGKPGDPAKPGTEKPAPADDEQDDEGEDGDEPMEQAAGARRKTVAGLGRRKRNFWLAERAMAPRRARPNANSRGVS